MVKIIINIKSERNRRAAYGCAVGLYGGSEGMASGGRGARTARTRASREKTDGGVANRRVVYRTPGSVGHAARASPCRIGPTASRSLRVRLAGLTVFTHADGPRAIAIDGRSIFPCPRPL